MKALFVGWLYLGLSVLLLIWLDSELEHRDRDNGANLNSSLSRVMALVWENERTSRRGSIWASWVAVARFDVRKIRNETHSALDENPCYFQTHESSCCCCCFCWLPLAAAGHATSCSCCLLLGVDAPAYSVGPHARYAKQISANTHMTS